MSQSELRLAHVPQPRRHDLQRLCQPADVRTTGYRRQDMKLYDRWEARVRCPETKMNAKKTVGGDLLPVWQEEFQ